MNIDLIAGMVGETWDNWRDAVRRDDRARRPTASRSTRWSCRSTRSTPRTSWATRSKRRSPIGRRSGPGSTTPSTSSPPPATPSRARTRWSRHPERVNFSYRDNLWQGSDLLATGIASFGHISGVHYQNQPEWEQYCGTLEAGELPLRPRTADLAASAAGPRDDPAAQARLSRTSTTSATSSASISSTTGRRLGQLRAGRIAARSIATATASSSRATACCKSMRCCRRSSSRSFRACGTPNCDSEHAVHC